MNVKTPMRLKVWGCRGSISVTNPGGSKYGSNTTCFEVLSDLLPPNMKLFVDAGSGFVPAGISYLGEVGKLRYVVLFSHYHYDHDIGLTLSPPTFIPTVPMIFMGPRDEGMGPEEVIQNLFSRPSFPVDSQSLTHKMSFKTMDKPDVTVLLIHPEGGLGVCQLDEFQKLEQRKAQALINKKRYKLEDCLVVKMCFTNHGNATCLSYRFEERATGKVLVICTDHEDVPSMSASLRNHMGEADLLIMDAQYDTARYQTQTAGFGHGTPEGAMRQAVIAGAKVVGITHHDPTLGTDEYLEKVILSGAQASLKTYPEDKIFQEMFDITTLPEKVFLCKDYQEIQL